MKMEWVSVCWFNHIFADVSVDIPDAVSTHGSGVDAVDAALHILSSAKL